MSKMSIEKFTEHIDDSIVDAISNCLLYGYKHGMNPIEVSLCILGVFKSFDNAELLKSLLHDAAERARIKYTNPGATIDYPGAERRDDIHANKNVNEREV